MKSISLVFFIMRDNSQNTQVGYSLCLTQIDVQRLDPCSDWIWYKLLLKS